MKTIRESENFAPQLLKARATDRLDWERLVSPCFALVRISTDLCIKHVEHIQISGSFEVAV